MRKDLRVELVVSSKATVRVKDQNAFWSSDKRIGVNKVNAGKGLPRQLYSSHLKVKGKK